MTDLKDYELEVLKRMLNEGFISNNYTSIENIESKIKWKEIARSYKVRRGFKRVARGLVKKGYLTDHGKSTAVLSLTKDGVKVALATSED
ncbi:MAG TPA: hypothetical protein EYP68_02205 [Candidatus Korarchaeota archaeon]|nr:hypothetical protein [Candidatus Korarchaeota archaeon]